MTRRAIALALDLGNVLVDYRPERTTEALARAARLSAERAAALAAALPDGLKRAMETGALGPRAFLQALNRAIVEAGGRALGLDEFSSGWLAALAPRPRAVALLARVPREVPLALWSNTDPVHFHAIAPEIGALSRFRSLHLSFLAGCVKPDRAFFEGALAALGARAEAVAFADDLARNVDAARALGIDAFLAPTEDALESGLRERGLIV